MCVQCAMAAAAGFGVFQTYRFVISDRARKWLPGRRPPPSDAAGARDDGAPDAQPQPERAADRPEPVAGPAGPRVSRVRTPATQRRGAPTAV